LCAQPVELRDLLRRFGALHGALHHFVAHGQLLAGSGFGASCTFTYVYDLQLPFKKLVSEPVKIARHNGQTPDLLLCDANC
jgi:hypothetical protein